MHPKIFTLFLFILIANTSSAQLSEVDTNATMVIANGGLRLREKPSKKSNTLTIIPFGTIIKYLEEKSFNKDSISNDSDLRYGIKKIHGHWVKILYENQVGYVLDIFLNRPKKKQRGFKEIINNEFRLIYPGCGCNNANIYDPSSWNWYGYFENSDSTLISQKVDISYYRTREYTCELYINASISKNLKFIIGSKSRLKKKVNVVGKDIILSILSTRKISNDDLKKFNLELIINKNNTEWKPTQLYLINDDKKMLLNKIEYDYPYVVKLIGDIDGDSLNDYIIHYGDKGGIIILYLTSQTESNQLIKAVAVFYSGYCC